MLNEIPQKSFIDDIDIITELSEFNSKLLSTQESLDIEWQKILFDNLWELYTDST